MQIAKTATSGFMHYDELWKFNDSSLLHTLLPAATLIISILGVTSSSSSSSPSTWVGTVLSASPLRVRVRDVGTLEYHLDLPPGVTISIFEAPALKMVPLLLDTAFRPVVLYKLMRKTMKPYSKKARLRDELRWVRGE